MRISKKRLTGHDAEVFGRRRGKTELTSLGSGKIGCLAVAGQQKVCTDTPGFKRSEWLLACLAPLPPTQTPRLRSCACLAVFPTASSDRGKCQLCCIQAPIYRVDGEPLQQ